MSFAQVTVIVAGAVESDDTFTDETLMNAFLSEVETDAKNDGYPTEVFVMYHDHALDIDCECAQYEQSGKPKLTFNMDSKGDWQ